MTDLAVATICKQVRYPVFKHETLFSLNNFKNPIAELKDIVSLYEKAWRDIEIFSCMLSVLTNEVVQI